MCSTQRKTRSTFGIKLTQYIVALSPTTKRNNDCRLALALTLILLSFQSKTFMKKFSFFLLCSFWTTIIFSQEAKDLIQLTDMLKIKTAGNITVSNDGSKAAFTVQSIEPDERSKSDYKYVTQLYTIDMSGTAAPVQLTHAKESSTSPAWSPDGKSLAFVRPVDGRLQIFILSLTGGEAWQLTKSVYGATAPRWSPDGSRMVYSASVQMKDLLKDSLLNPTRSYPLWPSEKPGVTYVEMQRAAKTKPNADGNLDEVRAYLLNNEADNKATVLNKLTFQDESGVTNSQSFAQFFVIETKLGAEPKPILTGFSRYASVDFTPDGNRLLITADIDSLEHPDRSQESEIYVADADGKNIKLLLGQKGLSYNNARLSPSGKWLAYFYGP